MEYREWDPIYRAILDDFGYDEQGDCRARDWLASRVEPFDLGRLDVDGTAAAVAGAAPSLEADASLAREADAIVAASDAATRLDDLGIRPDLVVTDLDGDPDGTASLASDGVPVAVHAHGDNRDALEEYLPQLPRTLVLGTTQAEPVRPLYNFGGFTDGDRAAFLADALGADRLVFPGWDFDDATGEKQRKLAWAARLLHWLERRRGAEFAVLDGHRRSLGVPGAPDP